MEIVEVVGRGVEIADLDGRAHVVVQRDALQFDRQGGHRGRHVLERVARLGPAALPRISQRPPQRCVVLVADAGLGQILERVVRPVHHHFGDRAQHQRRHAFGRLALVAERHVEHALGFRIHAARNVKARQREPRRQALLRRRRGGEIDEMRFVREIGALAIGAPGLRVENPRLQPRAVHQGLYRGSTRSGLRGG